MTGVEPLAWYTVVTGIGECVRAQLAGTDAGAPGRLCYPLAGQIADDDCCAGQLAVTVTRFYPSAAPPAEATGDDSQPGCGPPLLVADLTVRVTRCVPVIDDQGNPPSCAGLADSSLTWMADSLAVRQALGCCLQAMVDDGRVDSFGIGAAAASGPDGGCLASETSLWVARPTCLCPGGV